MATPHALSVGDVTERRLTAEHLVARALVEAATFAEAVPRILEAICEALGWHHGALWTIDRDAERLALCGSLAVPIGTACRNSLQSAVPLHSRAASDFRGGSGPRVSPPGSPMS